MRLRSHRVRLVLLVGLLACTGCQAWITRASISTSGSNPNGPSYIGDVTGDGRFLVFASQASDLVAGAGTTGLRNIFRRDLTTEKTLRVSVDVNGGDPDDASYGPSVSADGRYVAFMSDATDLVSADTNGVRDVFVRDMQQATTLRASVGTTGFVPPDWQYDNPSISADGKTVAFVATLRIQPGPGYQEVFVRDLATSTTELVTAHTGSQAGTTHNELPDVSGDGRYVTFTSDASDLVTGDANGFADVFLRDMQTNTTSRISVDSNGGNTNQFSGAAVISADGHHVAFGSAATDLVAGGPPAGPYEAYVRDLTTHSTSRVSVDVDGGATNGFNNISGISADGRYVSWWGDSSDLVSGDTNGTYDAFVCDRLLGETLQVSLDSLGRQADGPSQQPTLTADGRYVAFGSYADNLVAGDNGPPSQEASSDVFVRAVRRPTVTKVTPSSLAPGSTTNVTISGRGFGPGATVEPSAQGGVTVNSVTVVSDVTLTISVTVSPSAPTGPRNLTVSVPGLGPGVVPTSVGACSNCVSVGS